MKKRCLGLLLFCLGPALVLALNPAWAGQWPAPVQAMADKGITIIAPFDAPGGLRGYAARAGQTPVALYLTPDGQHVVVGTLLDAQGRNLTRAALAKATGQSADQPRDVWSELGQSRWIADGPDDAPRTVYVITDPNCPYCHEFFEAARPWVKAGRVQLRHVLVGVLKPSSPGKAAAILAADDPTAAYRNHERHYQSGGIAPMADISAALHDRISANDALMAGLGIRGTPGIIYHDDNGQIAIHQGLPQGRDLVDILGPRP